MSAETSPGNAEPTMPELGNLASSARKDRLKGVAPLFLFIGAISVLAGGFLLFNSPAEIDKVFADEINAAGPGFVVDEAKFQDAKAYALRLVQAIYASQVFIGVMFLLCALFVRKFPIAVTVSGLVLYLASHAFVAFFDPTQLVRGIIIKILIVVFLCRAISAAVAESKETEKDVLGEIPIR